MLRFKGFYRRSPILAILSIVYLLLSSYATAQTPRGEWYGRNIEDVFDGFDVGPTLELLAELKVSPLDYGRNLFFAGHTSKAIQWHTAMKIKTEDLSYVLGLARIKEELGDVQGAKSDFDHILSKKRSPLLNTRTHYHMGMMYLRAGDAEKAQKAVEVARQGYSELGKNGGQFLCHLAFGLMALNASDLESGEAHLTKALAFNDKAIANGFKGHGLGRYHEAMSNLRLRQSRHLEALEEAEKSAKAYQDKKQFPMAEEVQARVSFLLLLNGRPSEANTLASQLFMENYQKSQKKRLLSYLSLTLMKLELCANKSDNAQGRETFIRQWAKTAPEGNQILNLLEWVKDTSKFPCPEWR